MSIRCITFDLDDTLWDCAPVLEAAERVLYAWLEEHYPRITAHLDLEGMFRDRRAFALRHPELLHDMTLLRKEWLAEHASRHGYPDELIDHAFQVFWEHRNRVDLYAEVATLLPTLKARYRIGAITNGNADVTHIGIDHYFHFVTTSAAAGASKPAPEIFHAALAAAGVAPEHAVHVGDDPRTDILGAGAVGMRTVWFNPGLKPWPGGRLPDAVIRELGELEGVLADWE